MIIFLINIKFYANFIFQNNLYMKKDLTDKKRYVEEATCSIQEGHMVTVDWTWKYVNLSSICILTFDEKLVMGGWWMHMGE